MYRFKLYNSDEIDALQKELHFYRNALETMNIGDLIEKYIKAKSEVYSLKYDFLKQEGDINTMKEFFQEAIEKYEKAEQDLSTQIQAVNDSLTQLKEDVHWIKNQLKEANITTEFIGEVKANNDQQEGQVNNEKSEIDVLKEEILKLKEQMAQNKEKEQLNETQLPKQSEYRRLQNILQSSNLMESPTQNNSIQTPSTNYRGAIPTQSNHSNALTSLNHQTNRTGRSKNAAQFDLVNRTIIHSKKTANTQEFKKTNNQSAQPPSFHTNKAENTATDKHPLENSSDDDHDKQLEIKENIDTKTTNDNEKENISNDVKPLRQTSNGEVVELEQDFDNEEIEKTANLIPNQTEESNADLPLEESIESQVEKAENDEPLLEADEKITNDSATLNSIIDQSEKDDFPPTTNETITSNLETNDENEFQPKKTLFSLLKELNLKR